MMVNAIIKGFLARIVGNPFLKRSLLAGKVLEKIVG
jgi:hypothetical protein